MACHGMLFVVPGDSRMQRHSSLRFLMVSILTLVFELRASDNDEDVSADAVVFPCVRHFHHHN
jgi:hypothetical protein